MVSQGSSCYTSILSTIGETVYLIGRHTLARSAAVLDALGTVAGCATINATEREMALLALLNLSCDRTQQVRRLYLDSCEASWYELTRQALSPIGNRYFFAHVCFPNFSFTRVEVLRQVNKAKMMRMKLAQGPSVMTTTLRVEGARNLLSLFSLICHATQRFALC